jgi:GNAT superfamily N-acetyltransferase
MERIQIRLLTESDIPSAMELKQSAGWNQTEADWRRLLKLEPQGCFGAVRGNRLVGTTTTTTYGDELAWIGMVLVHPESRRMGIASQLMTTALDYLKEKVATVKLDATALGKPVYEKLGFRVESLVERWSGIGISTSFGSANETIDECTSRELFELDRRAFNSDRSELIAALIDDAAALPALVRSQEGSLTGYALARNGTSADYVGPVVANAPEQIDPLLDRMLNELKGRRVYIDFNAASMADSRLLVERGFVKERDLIRMCSGMPSKSTSPLVFAIAGPEIG